MVSTQGVLTYSELVQLVESRTAEFQKANLENCIVALQRKKSNAYVIDIVALLCAGAIVMPVDPSLPSHRRAQMLEISKANALIAEDGILTINDDSVSDIPQARLSKAAYVFFTSGSTGQPKAILGSACALRHFINWQGKEFEIESSDRIPFLTNIGFDVSLRDIFLPLHHGAMLFIPDEYTEEKPQITLSWMKDHSITRLHAVPSVIRIWSQCDGDPMPTLRTVFSAGEKLTSKILSAIGTITHPAVEVVNLYGPTETTLAKFFHRLNPISVIEGSSAPVGQPLPGTTYQLSAKGEIIITTPDASLGYLGSATTENSRFSAENTTYHTGDIGELDSHGLLYIIGRIDDQVKINGVRLHTKEIEHVLSQAPMVDDVVVLAIPNNTGDEFRLAAVWTGTDGDDQLPRSFAMERLPRPIVPTIWQNWKKLPTNNNGKTNRRAIHEILTTQTTQINPQNNDNSTQKWLCQVVKELLGGQDVKITDDFFAIGGTSLHIAFLIGKIEEKFSKTLAFKNIFENSKLKDVAVAIDNAPQNQTVNIPTIGKKDQYALSPQQRRWWNIYMPFSNRSWATMVRIIAFDHHVTERKLRKALFDLTIDQVAMQLSLHPSEYEIVQKITTPNSPKQMPVSTHDLSNMSNEEAKEQLDHLRLECANSEIATDCWPLFRCLLVYMPDNKLILVFAMHHMISDGFSMGLIETALRKSISEGVEQEPFQTFNYLDYAAWAKDQEPVLCGEGSQAELYWRKVFHTPYSKHIFKEKWTGSDHDRGQSYCCKVPHSLHSDIQKFARREHLTEFSIYFSAKFRAWHKLLNRDDLVIGTPAAGRDIAGTETLVGNLISLCCVRSRLDNAPAHLADYVRNIMEAVASGMTYQGYQYDTLVRSLDMEFEQNRFPLTTIFISYLNFETMRQINLNQSELGFSDLGFTVKFDIMSYVREHKDCASLQMQYRNNLFDKEDINFFSQLWLENIHQIATSKI